MEIGLTVDAEEFRLLERKKVLRAYFLFSLDPYQKVIRVVPETKEEWKRFFQAEMRRKLRQRDPISQKSLMISSC